MTSPTLRLALAACLFAAGFASAVAYADGAPVAAAAAPVVTLGGEVSKPLHLDAAALAKLPHVAVDGDDHGTRGHWEGVRLIDLLHEAGLPTGEAMRGKAMSLYVRIGAADGYRAVYALAELDKSFRDGEVILADRREGKPLDAKEGPFRVIAPSEKRPGRWVRQVTSIDVLRAPEP